MDLNKASVCRSCGHRGLLQVLDMGYSAPSNHLIAFDALEKPNISYPLKLLYCTVCYLIQTLDFHSSNDLFTSEYPYLSSTSKTWLRHTSDSLDYFINRFNLPKTALIAEVASNDGYLLEQILQRGIACYGIEPTNVAASLSKNKGHIVFEAFLDRELAHRIVRDKGVADLVIANNVFAHVPNLVEFTKAAKELLSSDGVLIIEVQYVGSLISQRLFDTIYHEHYSYFSISSMENLLNSCELEVFDVEFIPTHGGSIRIFAQGIEGKFKKTNFKEEFAEIENNTLQLSSLDVFQKTVLAKRLEIREFFVRQNLLGKKIAGVGAAAKASSILNFCGLSSNEITCIFDSATSKQEKFVPGLQIPIIELTAEKVEEFDLLIIFPWNIAEELLASVIAVTRRTIPVYSLMPKITKLNGA